MRLPVPPCVGETRSWVADHLSDLTTAAPTAGASMTQEREPRATTDPRQRRDDDPEATAGPTTARLDGSPEVTP